MQYKLPNNINIRLTTGEIIAVTSVRMSGKSGSLVFWDNGGLKKLTSPYLSKMLSGFEILLRARDGFCNVVNGCNWEQINYDVNGKIEIDFSYTSSNLQTLEKTGEKKGISELIEETINILNEGE